jgi:AcrR family transcriptional regulator
MGARRISKPFAGAARAAGPDAGAGRALADCPQPRYKMTDESVIFLRRGMVEAARPRRRRSARRPGRGGRPPDGRAGRRNERRAEILSAALDEFAACGFAQARLDDVARRAGVAKGTIYLYFRDKQSLFQELVRTMLSPLVGAIAAAPLEDLPIRAVVEMIVDVFVNEIYGTPRQDVIRLIISEGPRFPKLAEFYYGEVIARVLPVVRARLALAAERGEIAHDALARFPQLLVAPALMAILWGSLFGRFAPLDVRELMRAHLDLLFGKRSAT